MKTAVRPNTALLLILVLVIGIALGLLVARPLFQKAEPVDPHEGQVYIYDGFDWIWMTPLEGVPANPFTEADFRFVNDRPEYMGSDYETRIGVDVSWHQHEIDWKQVADFGIDFAYLRLGRRGYTEGGLFEDTTFEDNYRGARENGLPIGAYFYSQAISAEEAIEEADFVLEILANRNLELPIVFDWEKITNEDADIARTKGLDLATRTDCAVAFCEQIKSAGYTPAVYFNRNIGYYGYDLTRLTDYAFWFTLPDASWPSFYYAMDLWQYSWVGSVPGIEGETDMNLMFVPIAPPTDEPGSEPEAQQ